MTPPDTPGALRTRLLWAAKLLLAALVFWWLVASGRMELSQLRGVHERWPWLLAAVIATGAVQWLTVWRWRILLRVQGIEFTFATTLRICFIGLFFNQFLLGSVGGDLYRVFAVARAHPTRRSAGMVSVVVDRATGLLCTLMLVPIAVLFAWDFVWHNATLSYLVLAVLAVIATGMLTGVALLSRTVRDWPPVRWALDRLPMRDRMKRIDSAIGVHLRHKPAMAGVLLLGVVVQLLVVITNICLAKALVPELPSAAAFFLLVPMALAAMALPINPPGALGTAEAMYAFLFDLVGIGCGSLVSLLQRAVLIAWAIPGAILYVSSRGTPQSAPLRNSSPTAT
ncbi:MAG: flippase-like domain-containing protein [Planctomycetes bacterium]|nr:flippase-like domain-containing protein [Planctomycetota bacterium]MCB9872336.1 flippase-like domain-containing protein [Planctomycetota bacterium]MCB9889827.1 flippase-like domain-containing protein [Planctomycetota bacterium]